MPKQSHRGNPPAGAEVTSRKFLSDDLFTVMAWKTNLRFLTPYFPD
jgi:hypothetical protein